MPAVVGLCAAAAFFTYREHRRLPESLVVAAGLLVVVSQVWPAASERARSAADWLGRVVSRVLSMVLMGAFWVLVVLPVSLLNRLVGVDLLSRTIGWQTRSDRALPRRAYGRESGLAGQIGRRTTRAVVVASLVALAALPVVDRVWGTTPSTDPPFGPRASGPPPGVVYHDEWVNFEGIKVSRHLFPGEPWAAALLTAQNDDHLQQHQVEDPRYGWRNIDVSERNFHVVDGHRATLRQRDPDLTIWLFGGSTVYGFGQRDDHTIASDLVREAERDGHRTEVVNFGVPAYVNWQETQVFADQLRSGARPDLAVFLDGVNDGALAYERELFGLLDASQPVTRAATRALQRQREASALARGWRVTHDYAREARLIAEQYRLGVERARSLGRAYGVPVVHFWQPFVATMPGSAPGVPTVLNNMGMDPALLPVSQRTVKAAARQSGVHPIDLTDIFDQASQPVFFDWAHTNEAGARIEAAAMYDFLAPALARADSSQGGSEG